MTKDHGLSVKDDETYEALREDGASKQKAARIANAQANSDQHPSEKGGKQPPYEDCLLYTSPSPRDLSTSRMPSSA